MVYSRLFQHIAVIVKPINPRDLEISNFLLLPALHRMSLVFYRIQTAVFSAALSFAVPEEDAIEE